MKQIVATILLSAAALVGCQKTSQEIEAAPTPAPTPVASGDCSVFFSSSCALSQMLTMPNLVWSVRCDQGQTVVAKYRVNKDAGLIVFWTKLPTTDDPILLGESALMSVHGGVLGFVEGLDVKKTKVLSSGEFFGRLQTEAPRAVMFLTATTQAKAECVRLRINATE